MTKMGNKPGGGRNITAEEAELWQHTTRTLHRLKAKSRVAADVSSAPPVAHQSAPDSRPKLQPPAKRSKAAQAPTSPPRLAEFEARKARRIGSGKIQLGGRLDLHGSTQRQARSRLRAFLLDAHARGLKTVLVITGKGGEQALSDHLARVLDERMRGVLRRMVPVWLQEPEFSAIVVSFTSAGARHGGDGAFYVQLRRARG